MSSASLHGGIVHGEKYCDILYWLLQNESNNFINAKMLQWTILDQNLIFMNLKLLPLSLSPIYFSVQQRIKNKQNGSHIWPRAVTECALWHFKYSSGEDSVMLSEIRVLSVVLPLPKTGNSLRCEWHRNALAQSDLLADTAKQQSDWVWNIYERE